MTMSLRSAACATVAVLLLLTACGSSSTTTPAPTGSASSAPPTPSPSASTGESGNAALAAALSTSDVGQVQGGGGITQKSDGLLGGAPNTDARVFDSSDGSLQLEVDLVADSSSTSASNDYATFQDAASKQVAHQTGTSSPNIGKTSNEYMGTNSAGANAVSISFLQGSYIAVLTLVSTGSASPGDLKSDVEGVAMTQASKIPTGT